MPALGQVEIELLISSQQVLFVFGQGRYTIRLCRMITVPKVA